MKCQFCGEEGASYIEFYPKEDFHPLLQNPTACARCFIDLGRVAKELNERALDHDEIQKQTAYINDALQKMREANSVLKPSHMEQRSNLCPLCGNLQNVLIPR